MKRIGKAVARVSLVVLVLGGFVVFVTGSWIGSQFPSAFAKPNTFTVIETYTSPNAVTPVAVLYLEAPSSPSDLSFEGTDLRHDFRDMPNRQGNISLKGVVVSGSGTIIFGTARITVKGGAIAINGRELNYCSSEYMLLGTPSYEIRNNQSVRNPPLEIVLGRNGWYHSGHIRLGNGLIMRLLYR